MLVVVAPLGFDGTEVLEMEENSLLAMHARRTRL